MGKRYRIELTEKQLRVVYDALDEYGRIAVGQFEGVASRLVFYRGADLEGKDYKLLSQRSKHAKKVMDVAWEIATERSFVRGKDEDIAEDMRRYLRDEVYDPDGCHCEHTYSDEPPIKVEVLDD